MGMAVAFFQELVVAMVAFAFPLVASTFVVLFLEASSLVAFALALASDETVGSVVGKHRMGINMASHHSPLDMPSVVSAMKKMISFRKELYFG